MSANEEIGITLALSPEAARKLIKNKSLKPLRRGKQQRRHVTSTYFDTPRHVLRKSGIALRLRDEGSHKVQTIQAPAGSPFGLQNRFRWSSAIESDEPLLSEIDDPTLARRLAKKRCEDRLQSVFITEVDRTTMRLKTGDAEIQMAVDQGFIRVERNGLSREEAICEAELGLLSGDPTQMLDLALGVCETLDVRLAHTTKAQRGYALARPALRPRSRKATLVTLSSDVTAGEAFRLIVSSALEHLFHNEEPVARGQPGGVHQGRVAMRRVRAALRAFKALLPYDKRKAFNSEFRSFQQRLAPARDWHVFLDETVPLVARSAPRSRANIEKLRRLAREERRRATREASAAFESRRYARLILQFQKWLASLEDEIPKDSFDRPIAPFALGVLRRSSRDLLRETRPLRRLPGEDLHDLRKRGKKARYATEFFSTLWTGHDVKPYLKLMSRLQDKLGAANDAAVARQILWTVRPGRLDAEVVRLVQDWSEARIDDCIRDAQPHWRRLRKATPFWESAARNDLRVAEALG